MLSLLQFGSACSTVQLSGMVEVYNLELADIVGYDSYQCPASLILKHSVAL